MDARLIPRVPWGRLALLLLACALLRGFLILAPPDDFFENGEVPHEELLRGVAALDLLEGPLVPVQLHQVNNFWGGSLVVSLLATGPFAAFGPHLVALRAVALVFGLACVLLVFLVLHRHASPRAAWIGATLLAFAPPGYALSSCTTYGTHLEANALALLVAWAFLEERRAPSDARALALGAALGFALWFGFSLILVVLAWLVHELARDRAFLVRRRGLWIAAGFVAGFAPWIRYQLVHGWSGLAVYDEGLAGHLVYGLSRGGAAEKLLATVASLGPRSFFFRDTLGVPGIWVGRVLVLLAGAVVVRAAWIHRAELAGLVRGLFVGTGAGRATPATFACVFLAAFAVTYLVSAFDVDARDFIFDYRYLMPPVPFVLLLAGVVGADLARRGSGTRRLVLAATLVLAAASAVGTLRQARPERWAANLAAPAATDARLVRFLARGFAHDPEAATAIAVRIAERRASPRREELLAAFGRAVRALAARPGTTARDAARAAGAARSAERIPAALPPDAAAAFRGP